MTQERNTPNFPKADWKQNELEWLEACPICFSSRSQPLHTGIEDFIFSAASGKWNLIKCNACSGIYLNPRPTRKTIGRAYSNYYTHSASASENQPLSSLQWIRRATANGYRNRLYGTKLHPSLGHVGSAAAFFSRRFRNAIETEAAGLVGVRPTKRGVSAILDVGCGSGLTLKRARDAGWRVMGIEPDPNAVIAAAENGVEIIASDVTELSQQFNGTFERILLNHVIEHVHDPLAMLKRCKELLLPSGSLWLETPNSASVGHEEFGLDWRGLEPPRHLFIFELTSIERLLKEAGFTRISVSEPRDVIRYMFERSLYIRNMRRESAGGEASNTSNHPALSLEDLIKENRERVSAHPNQSEFITLEATA